MSSETVGAIIPCYNDSAYVDRAIETCLNQTATPDEIIIVDDASTDETERVVSEYLGRDPVKYICHSTNQGAAAARNTGIRESNCEYIAFLDADDEWLINKIESQIKLMQEQETLGMVYSDFYRISPDGNPNLGKALETTDEEFVEKLFVAGGGILPSSVMVRRDCIEDVGLFDERLKVAHDRNLWLRIGSEYEVQKISEPLVRRHVRPNSLASNYEQKYECEQITTKEMVEKEPSLRNVVDKREAHLLYNRASFRLSNGRARAARRDVLQSIRIHPLVIKAYLLAMSTLLGDKFGKMAWLKLKRSNLRMTTFWSYLTE